MAHWCSSESIQRELCYEYPHDLVRIISIIFCFFVHWTKVTSAAEGLICKIMRSRIKCKWPGVWSSPVWASPLNIHLTCHKWAPGQQALNPLMLAAAKTAWQFWWNLSSKSVFGKIFEGEMLIRTLPTTLLQIFCKISFNPKVIVRSTIDPDDNFYRNF